MEGFWVLLFHEFATTCELCNVDLVVMQIGRFAFENVPIRGKIRIIVPCFCRDGCRLCIVCRIRLIWFACEIRELSLLTPTCNFDLISSFASAFEWHYCDIRYCWTVEYFGLCYTRILYEKWSSNFDYHKLFNVTFSFLHQNEATVTTILLSPIERNQNLAKRNNKKKSFSSPTMLPRASI